MAMSGGSYASRVVATAVVATDGTGDFTTIQAAIDSLPAGGGVVYIKEGIYTITTALTITSDKVAIIGSGRSTSILTTSAILLLTITGDDCTIEKILFKGNDNSSQKIRIRATRCTIKDCWIEDCNIAIDIQQGEKHFILNNYISSCTSDGIRLGVATEAAVDESLINGNVCLNNANGISMLKGSRNIIINNFTLSNSTDGINIEAEATNTLVHGNMSYNNTGLAIDDNSATSTLADNVTP